MGQTAVAAACAAALAGCASTHAETATAHVGVDAAAEAPRTTGSPDEALDAQSADEASSETSACLAQGGQCELVDDCASPMMDIAGCGPGMMCCFLVICAADADVPPILASNYDQTFDADTDCVPVAVGIPCVNCFACWPNTAINMACSAQHESDLQASPAGRFGCFCPYLGWETHCSAGTCSFSYASAGDARRRCDGRRGTGRRGRGSRVEPARGGDDPDCRGTSDGRRLRAVGFEGVPAILDPVSLSRLDISQGTADE